MRYLIALAFLVPCVQAIAGEMTLEKAERFQKLQAIADAEQIEIRSEIAAGGSGASVKEPLRVIRQLKEGKMHAAIMLESKDVGSIGCIACEDARGYQILGRDGESLIKLGTAFEALGGSDDNGRTFNSTTIAGYGPFWLRGYREQDTKGTRYPRPKGEPVVYEVVGHHDDGAPIVEPFDVKAAKKLLAGQKRKRIKTD